MSKDMVPKKIFFTKGVGKHRERLTSFELALRDAGIAAQNLVRVSSIFPPQCKLVARSQGLKYLSPGEVVFAVVAENSTHEPHRLLASSIGVAIPADRNTYGYLSEHHSFGETEDAAGDYAEELAAEMLATTLNVEFDPDRSWDEKKEIYRISNKIVRTANVTQSAVGDKRGLVDHGDRLGRADLRLKFEFGRHFASLRKWRTGPGSVHALPFLTKESCVAVSVYPQVERVPSCQVRKRSMAVHFYFLATLSLSCSFCA